MANRSKEMTNLIGTPIQKAGQATSKPNLTAEIFDAGPDMMIPD
jgi:hypothetical protein